LSINFLLIPTFGMMGAAAAALIAFVFQCTLQVVVGHRLYPIPYEWGRIARLTAVGVAIYFAGAAITWSSVPAALVGKGLLLLTGPLLLYAIGFFEPGEMARVKMLFADFRRGRAAARPVGGS